MARRFRFTINGQIFHANMQDTPLVEQLVALCPFEQEFTRNTGNEYYTRMQEQLTDVGCDMISNAKRNMICYFKGWNALNFIFVDSNISPFQIAYAGDFEEDVSEVLKAAGTTITVLCEAMSEQEAE